MRLQAALGSLILLAAAPASSAIQSLEVVPTTWRLENYTGDSVVIHYTGASCGTLYFGTGWSQDDRNRLWSLVSAAKVAGRFIGVRYEDSNCQIASFFFKES